MKTEFERISEIIYTLLEHQPVIDVPYEKINDIAVALVKEGYGKVSEYETEREMLGSQIKVLKQRLNDKYVEVDNLNRDYSNAFERLKAQEKEIERLKEAVKQAKIEVLNRVMTYINNKIENDYGDMSDSVNYLTIDIDDFDDFIDGLIEEVENEN